MSNIIIANEKNYIFISYAHKDMDEVFPIIEELQQQFCLWYDEGIDPGTEWDDNIAEHIENCTIMLSFISQAYLDSENCKDELNYARDLGKKRLLIYIEDVKLPGGMSMRLGRQQAIYYHKYFDKKDFFSKLSVIYEIEECRVEGNVSLSVTEGKTELEPGMISERQTDDEPSDQWEQYNLGYSYEFGTNGVKDYKKAVEYAPKEIAKSYEEQAEFVEGVRKEFLENKIPPYEVVFNANPKSKNYDKVKEALSKYNTFIREDAKKGNLEARLFQAVSTAKSEVLLVEDEKDLVAPKIKNLYDRFILLCDGPNV